MSRRRGPLLQPRSARQNPFLEACDFLFSADLQHGSQGVGSAALVSLRLVTFVGLVLRQQVAQLVNALLVKGLEGLEDEGSLRIPLLGGRLQSRRGICHLLGVRLRAFPSQSLGLFLSILEVSGHGSQVGGDGLHVLHFLAGLEVAQGTLDIFFELARENVVGVGS